jgi:hypothetical protein
VQRVALVVDAGVRELLSAGERPVVRQVYAYEFGAATDSATVTVSGSAALGPMAVAGEITVGERRSPINGHLLVMVILWLVVLVGPEAIMKANLSPGVTWTLDAYYAVVAAIAVPVAADYCQKRRRR